MNTNPINNPTGRAGEAAPTFAKETIRIVAPKKAVSRLHFLDLVPITFPTDRRPVVRRPSRRTGILRPCAVSNLGPLSPEQHLPLHSSPLPYIEHRLPVARLKIDPARFQFKDDCDNVGVVPGERLAGEYVELGTGRLIVWQDRSQIYWVSDGHHRLDLAIRVGKSDLPVYLLCEVDGWTVEMAIASAAHANILNGTGKPEDYVRYFRNSPITKDEAVANGLLGRKKGRDAWAIGKQAGETLYAFYLNQDDSRVREAAVVIAQGAPGDDALQEEALRYFVSEGATSLEVSEYIGVTRQWGNRSRAAQMTLFGPDLEANLKALAKAAAGILAEIYCRQQDLRQAMKRHGRLQLTEGEARRYGITDRGDVRQLKRALETVNREVFEWERWQTDHAKTLEVRQRAGLTPSSTASQTIT